jgi:hypothetical protein
MLVLLPSFRFSVPCPQVVSSLPSTLHQPFGLYSGLLLRVLSHASLPSLQALPWACFSGSMLFSHAPGNYSHPSHWPGSSISCVN